MKIISFILILITGILVQAKGPDASLWSLRYMARASNTLLVASQQSLDHQKVICGISGAKISQLSQNLKSLIDAKISILNASQKKLIRQQFSSCQSDCSCDIFAYYFENSSIPEEKKALEQIRSSVERINTQSRSSCAKKFPEFCDSSLRKLLSK